MRGNVSANQCVAIGTGAMAGVSTQDGTIAIGYKSLTALTSGVKNTAIGYDAMGDALQSYNNVAIGYESLNALAGDDINNAGGNNIAIGVDSMGSLNAGVHGSARANMNIAIGTSAFLAGSMADSSASVSQGNVCIGHEAAMTTGTNAQVGITAIGHRALKALTTGAGNTAIGYQGMTTGTTAAESVAIGYQAMATHLDGNRNIAIGYQAMTDTNAGTTSDGSTDNIFIGKLAGGGTWANAESNSNVAIGNLAMDAAMDGALYNVALGDGTLSALTQGDYNIAIGGQCGVALTTGSQNILIGTSAGDGLIAEVNNVVIGHDAMTHANPQADACVAIGAVSMGGDLTSDADGTIAIGYYAGNAITSGIGNVAIG